MLRRPPGATRPDTLFPSPALFRSLLIAMGLYFRLAPPMSSVDRRARTGPLGLTLIVAALGFYDGFFGPGTGSFLTLTLVALGGLGLVRAIGNTKFLNLRSEEHTSELQSLMRISYAVFCLKKKKTQTKKNTT